MLCLLLIYLDFKLSLKGFKLQFTKLANGNKLLQGPPVFECSALYFFLLCLCRPKIEFMKHLAKYVCMHTGTAIAGATLLTWPSHHYKGCNFGTG
jgi:hypothetical protein